MPVPCSVSENTLATNENAFWDLPGPFWDVHRMGWAVAGGCTVLVRSFSNLSFQLWCSIFTDNTDIIVYYRTTPQVRSRGRYRNAGIWRIIASSRNYTNPNQQRQMLALVPKPLVCFWLIRSARSLRILYMPPIYAIISFFSYRFFRAYTYCLLIQASTFVRSFIASSYDLNFTYSLWGKFIPKESQKLDWATRI
jgi:hypothetical protein